MHALENSVENRPATVSNWIDELAKAVEQTSSNENTGTGRLTILAPVGAEVYVDDERKGSIGSSGRIVLNNVPPGQHVLRVSRRGERDDERLIEIREDSAEQVIQAVLRVENFSNNSQPSSSQSNIDSTHQESVPDVVVCVNCQARFAAGVKFCGRCGNSNFRFLHPQNAVHNQSSPNATESSHQTSPMNSTAPHRFVINTTANSGYLNCPRCNKVLPANAKFCGGCGLQLTEGLPLSGQQPNAPTLNRNSGAVANLRNVVCGRCQAVYALGTKFCGKCGSQI
jgi:ribosomal protein L40E